FKQAKVFLQSVKVCLTLGAKVVNASRGRPSYLLA
ncbi:unnamed protein product, partial [marine sediment metagenome]